MAPEIAYALLVLAVGAFFAPILARRFRFPSAVAEILFGVIVGSQCLGLVEESEVVVFLGRLGFVFLMFLAGLEIDFGILAGEPRARRRGLAGALAISAAAAAFAAFSSRPFLAWLLLSAMSLGIIIPTLREARLSSTPWGQTLLVMATFGEVLTLLGFSTYEIWIHHGLSVELVMGLSRLAVACAIAVFLLRLLVVAAWWMPERLSAAGESDDPVEFGVRGTFLLLFILVAVTVFLGVEAIIGAFLAGAIVSFAFRDTSSLGEKMAGAGFGFFVPVFFIHVGMSFDISAVANPRILGASGALAILILFLRFAAAPILLRAGPPRRALAGAMLLACPLTLLVAISEMALLGGRISDVERSVIVLAALFSSALFPSLFRRVADSSSRETRE